MEQKDWCFAIPIKIQKDPYFWQDTPTRNIFFENLTAEPENLGSILEGGGIIKKIHVLQKLSGLNLKYLRVLLIWVKKKFNIISLVMHFFNYSSDPPPPNQPWILRFCSQISKKNFFWMRHRRPILAKSTGVLLGEILLILTILYSFYHLKSFQNIFFLLNWIFFQKSLNSIQISFSLQLLTLKEKRYHVKPQLPAWLTKIKWQ